MSFLFANNAASTLLSGITDTDLTLVVQAGKGALFPSPAPPDTFRCTLEDSAGNIEVVEVTDRAADVFTIVRNIEGTGANAYIAGDAVELRITKETLEEFLQVNNRLAVDKAGNYTAVEGDKSKILNATAAITLDLPDVSTISSGYWVIIKNSHSADITVGRDNASDTVDGAAADVILSPGQASVFVRNATANGYLQEAKGNFKDIVATSIITTGLTVNGIEKLSKGADIASENALTLGSGGNYFGILGNNSPVTNATQANPCAVTATAHGRTTGDTILISDVVGMTELNDLTYVITVTDVNNFTLDGINSTGFGAYTSDGTVNPAISSIDTVKVGTTIKLFFPGEIALIHHATNFIIVGGANLITEAGDHAILDEYAVGDWRLSFFQRKSGKQVVPISTDQIAAAAVGRNEIANSVTTSAGNLGAGKTNFLLNNWALFPMIHVDGAGISQGVMLGVEADGGSASSPRFALGDSTNQDYDVDHRWILAA